MPSFLTREASDIAAAFAIIAFLGALLVVTP